MALRVLSLKDISVRFLIGQFQGLVSAYVPEEPILCSRPSFTSLNTNIGGLSSLKALMGIDS